MALKSVYLPDPAIHNDLIDIGGEEHHHLVVTRAESGEKIEVFDGQGRVWSCSVVSVGKRATSLRIEAFRMVPPPAIQLILGQALIRNAAFELALEKTVEVGITRIIPFVAARSNVTSPRLDRSRRIIIEAAKQSKHFHVPPIEPVATFQQVLSVPVASRIIFSERQGSTLKSSLTGTPVLYLIGPEGGWTEEEVELAKRAGFQTVSLGTGILRSETAAIVGGALIRHELGDL